MRALAGAAVLEGLIGYALVTGLAVRSVPIVSEPLKLFGILPKPPPPPPPPPPPRFRPSHQARAPKPEGGAAPPNLRATPTEIVAVPPRIPLPVPPPVAAAPIAGTGSAPSAGAAPVPGPGTGSGGEGNGTGSGRGGTGEGGGGGGSPPVYVKGRIRDRDYPRSAGEAGISGTVQVTFRVAADGRPHDCWISRSSGNRDLDVTTCELIEQRFRYKPARDAAGRPVDSWLVERHEWIVDRDHAPPDDEDGP